MGFSSTVSHNHQKLKIICTWNQYQSVYKELIYFFLTLIVFSCTNRLKILTKRPVGQKVIFIFVICFNIKPERTHMLIYLFTFCFVFLMTRYLAEVVKMCFPELVLTTVVLYRLHVGFSGFSQSACNRMGWFADCIWSFYLVYCSAVQQEKNPLIAPKGVCQRACAKRPSR